MILYQLIGLHCYHPVLVVDVWVGEQSRFSGQRRAGFSLSDTIQRQTQNTLGTSVYDFVLVLATDSA